MNVEESNPNPTTTNSNENANPNNASSEINMALEDLIKKRQNEKKNYHPHKKFFFRRRYNRENNKREPGKDNRRRLIVTNLNKEFQNPKLAELFGKCGTLVRCGIRFDQLGKSKGEADIEYSTHEEAEAAISKLNEADINGEKIKVAYKIGGMRIFRRNQMGYRRRKYLKYNNRNKRMGGGYSGDRMRFRRGGTGGMRRYRRNGNRSRNLGGDMMYRNGRNLRNGRMGNTDHKRVVLRSVGRRMRRNKN